MQTIFHVMKGIYVAQTILFCKTILRSRNIITLAIIVYIMTDAVETLSFHPVSQTFNGLIDMIIMNSYNGLLFEGFLDFLKEKQK